MNNSSDKSGAKTGSSYRQKGSPQKQSDVSTTPRIVVVGVGGAGGNAVNNMIANKLEGVEFIAADTDMQALAQSKAKIKVQLGAHLTDGLGAGMRPEIGAEAAKETLNELIDHVEGAHMCFITAGMGGGTGTGAAPIVARAVQNRDILTVGVITKPFTYEGRRRMELAVEGSSNMQEAVDTLIVIPNQNLFSVANEKTSFTGAFMMADDVLYQGVRGVTDLMVRPGLINLDFADICTVMNEMGKAMMGAGQAKGEGRAIQAAERAISNPLLEEASLNGASGVLINVTCGPDLTLFEMDEAANRIRSEVNPDANIIIGSTLDPSLEGVMRVSVIATGIDAESKQVTQESESSESLMGEPVGSIIRSGDLPASADVANAEAGQFSGNRAQARAQLLNPQGSIDGNGQHMQEGAESQQASPYSAIPTEVQARASQRRWVAPKPAAEQDSYVKSAHKGDQVRGTAPDTELRSAEAAGQTAKEDIRQAGSHESKSEFADGWQKGRNLIRKMTGASDEDDLWAESGPTVKGPSARSKNLGLTGAEPDDADATEEANDGISIPAFLKGRQAS